MTEATRFSDALFIALFPLLFARCHLERKHSLTQKWLNLFPVSELATSERARRRAAERSLISSALGFYSIRCRRLAYVLSTVHSVRVQ